MIDFAQRLKDLKETAAKEETALIKSWGYYADLPPEVKELAQQVGPFSPYCDHYVKTSKMKFTEAVALIEKLTLVDSVSQRHRGCTATTPAGMELEDSTERTLSRFRVENQHAKLSLRVFFVVKGPKVLDLCIPLTESCSRVIDTSYNCQYQRWNAGRVKHIRGSYNIQWAGGGGSFPASTVHYVLDKEEFVHVFSQQV